MLYNEQWKIKWYSSSTTRLSHILQILSSLGMLPHLPVSISNGKIPQWYCARYDKIQYTHTMSKDTIADISDVLPLEQQINKRFVNFCEKCTRNSNSDLQCIMQVSIKNPKSPFGKNIRKYVQVDVMYRDWCSRRDIINDDVNVIRELLDVHENLKSINVLNDCDESLCIN